VQDSTEWDAGICDIVASTLSADGHTSPVVSNCLIGIDDNVVSLA
jgi:hypothetical protein